jgi:hypothetical protein
MRAKYAIFAAIPSLVAVAVLVAAWVRIEPHKTAEVKGKDLNQRAWEATFVERGLPVPESGPRDGYWGSRLIKRRDNDLVYVEAEQAEGNLFSVDANGLQHWRSTATPAKRILIVGGSVAWGAGASSEATTYFAVAGRKLETDGVPSEITVLASGAWKSIQERAAILSMRDKGPFDLVVIVSGLNDLTVGTTVDDLQSTPGQKKGAHAGDFTVRAIRYVENVGHCADMCRSFDFPLLVVLQPLLIEKGDKSRVENELAAASMKGVPSKDIATAYAIMRTGLSSLAAERGFAFADASRVFEAESTTTFTDLWHFSDPGHAILGHALATEVGQILVSQEK